MDSTFSLEEINEVATEFWKAVVDAKIFAIHGPMGSGKTTFIHALCDAKGVKDVVGSPTFSIINEYEYVPTDTGSKGTKKSLFHIDLYRLKDKEEALRAGVEDCLYSGYICMVEWPEKAPGIFPAGTVHVFLEQLDDKTRRLRITDN